MMSAIIAGAISEALAAGASKIALEAGRRLAGLDEVGKAIRATSHRFGVDVALALRAWTTSDEFERLSKLCVSGELNDDELADSFKLTLRLSGHSTATIEDAREVLLTFAANWRVESLRGENAVLLHDEFESVRFEHLGNEIRSRLDQSDAGRDSRLDRMEAKLLTFLGSLPAPVNDGSAAHEASRDRVNVARKFVNEGRLKAARDILAEIQSSEQFPSLPIDLRFSALTNLGVAQLRLGNTGAGEAALKEALDLKPADPIATSNVSTVLLRLGRHDEALDMARRAFDSAPNDQRVRVNLISILREVGNDTEAQRLLLDPDEWSGEASLMVAVAETYSAFGRYQQAEAVARRAVEGSPNDVAALGVLAATILSNRPPAPETIARTRLDEVDALLARGIAIADEWDDRTIAAHLYANRSALRGMQGQVDQGLEDANKALHYDPTNATALLNKGLFHLQLQDYAAALNTLTAVIDAENTLAARVPLALAALQLDDLETARIALAPVLTDSDHEDFLDAADLLLQVAERSSDRALLSSVLDQLRDAHASHRLALIPLAHHQARMGDVDTAVRMLTDLLSNASAQERQQVALELATTYFMDSRFAEAAAVFDTFVTADSDHLVLRNSITSLFNSGDWQNALLWARRVRAGGPAVPVVSEIEAMVLDAIGDASAAKELYRQLALADPTNVRLRLKVIGAEVRLNEYEAARAALGSLSVRDIGRDPHDLLRAAGLRHILGLGDVMPLAYRALQLGFDEDDVQSAYLGFFLRHEDEVGDPIEVGDDCLVTLQTKSGAVSYTITSDPDEAKRDGWFASGSPLAVVLRGHRVGDLVTVYRSVFGSEQVGTIETIRSKYAAAFTRVMSEYPARFPRSTSVQVGEADPSKVLELIKSADNRRREVEKLYASGLLGIGGLAQLIDRSELETFGMLVEDPSSRIIAYTGDSKEIELENAALPSDQVTLDLSSLLTIHLTEIADEVKTAVPLLIVAIQTLDELTNYLAMDTLSSEKGLGLRVDGDTVIAIDIEPEQRDRRRAFVEQVRQFATSTGVAVLAGRRIAEMTREDRERTVTRIGDPSLASIAVAAENNSILCVDDLVSKRLAHEEWGVKTISTAALLNYLHSKRMISDDKFVAALGTLAISKFFFLRFSGKDLFDVFVSENLSITPPVTRLLDHLAGPDCDMHSAAGVLAIFIRLTTTTVYVPALRTMVISLAAITIMRGRNPAPALAALRHALRIAFQLIPHQLRGIEADLMLWEQRASLVQGH